MNVLITGGTGFIGGCLCRKLAREGHKVRALVRRSADASDLRALGVETVTGDLRNPASLQAATAGVDTVFHFAAIFRKEVPRAEILKTNVGGLANLLAAAAGSKVRRFVHCSSTSVYGLQPKVPTTEESPFVPIPADLYQESKLAAEEQVRRYGAEGRMETTIFRTTGVYGPGDVRFLKLFKAIAKRRFVMIGPGEVLFSMIYIDDLLDGAVRCAIEPVAINNHYLLTGSNPITLNETAGIIADALEAPRPRLHVPAMPVYFASWVMERPLKPLGISPPLYRRRVNFFRIMRGFSNGKARRELGFQPKVALAEGARRTIEWYRKEALL